MGARDQKKARQRQKRKQKQQASRRKASVSPYRKLASSGDVTACYIQHGWEHDGTAAMFVVKRSADRRLALIAFFVDLWCMGLKDAWGRLGMTSEEIDEAVNRSPHLEFERIDLDTVRELVAGGIRFAQDNGFRLPHRYERWTAVLGDLGDLDQADLRRFGADGKLRLVAPLEDVRKRLIGSTVDEFIARPDVEYLVDVGEPLPPDEAEAVADMEDIDRTVETTSENMLQAVRQWCFAQKIPPHPDLHAACELMLEGIMHSPDVWSDDDEAQLGSLVRDVVNNMLAFETPEYAERLRAALAQIGDYMANFDSPHAFIDTIGLDSALDDAFPDEFDDADHTADMVADMVAAALRESKSAEEMVDRVRLAVRLAESALDPDLLERHRGRVMEYAHAIPYLLARQALAHALDTADRPADAIAEYVQLLELDPADDMGIHQELLCIYLREGLATEAGDLLDRFRAPDDALWCWAHVLERFLSDGESAAADALPSALEANRHAADYLTERASPPDWEFVELTPGSEDEGAYVGLVLGEAWHEQPAAQAWLDRATR